VNQVSDHEHARGAVQKQALFEPKAVDAELVDDAVERRLGFGVPAVNPKIGPFLRQTSGRVNARRRVRSGPITELPVVERVRPVEMLDAPDFVHERPTFRREGDRRMDQQRRA
jgi:hypothetical protein